MKKLITAGVLGQPFGSFPAISQSDDGIVWDPVSQPFAPLQSCTGVATDGTTVVAANNIGSVAITTDLVNFVENRIFDGFSTIDIGYKNSSWITVGQKLYTSSFGPYGSLTEVAQIYKSSDPSGTWDMVWSHPNNNSRIYQQKWFDLAPITSTFTDNVWVICGTNGQSGDVWYSLDYGASWAQGYVPSGVGTIYSVNLIFGYSEPIWLWGCKGKIFKSSSLHDDNWNEILLDDDSIIVDMVSNDAGELVISGTNRIYVSINLANFIPWSHTGYVYGKLVRIDDRWLVFARSLLTQYTFWHTNDLINWYPLNNNIHVSGYTTTI